MRFPALELTLLVLCIATGTIGCGAGPDSNAREVAEFVLKHDGSLSIVDEQLEPKTVDRLPTEPFSIEKIVLQSPKITDQDLEQFKTLHSLRNLNLYQTEITDQGLVHIAGLTTLRELELSYTHVTDKGLDHLMGLKRLKKLFLRGTAVTEEGAQPLKKRLSGCKIYLETEPLK